MEQERMQKVIRKQIFFRMTILLFSILGCLFNFYFNKTLYILSGIVLGISASAFVWALMEIVDFYINTYHLYNKERNQFFKNVFNYWDDMKNIVKKDPNNIAFWELKSKLEIMYDFVALYPFEGPLFSISKDFSDAYFYIWRLYWKFHACFWNGVSELSKDSKEYNELYSCLFIDTVEYDNRHKRVNELLNIPEILHKMIETKVCFEKYEPPKVMFTKNQSDVITETIFITSPECKYKIFTPIRDFQTRFQSKKMPGALLTVSKLIFRNINSDFVLD